MKQSQQKVLEVLQQSKEPQPTDDEDLLVFIHHVLLKEYGWIPFNEFKNLPIPTVLNLLVVISEEKRIEREEAEKAKPKNKRVSR